MVYDIHHHRCNRDGFSEEEVTEYATATWNREPMFNISSPIEGWDGLKPERHHDFINVKDFPIFWHDLDLTVEVEAKAKEVAVLKLKKQLVERWFVTNGLNPDRRSREVFTFHRPEELIRLPSGDSRDVTY